MKKNKNNTPVGFIVLDAIEKSGMDFSDRLPALSSKTKETIISSLPYVVALIGSASLFLGIVNLLGKTLRLLLVSRDLLDFHSIFLMTINIASGFLLLSAITYLQKHKISGWRYVLYATLLTGSYNVISNPYALVLTFLFFYILFQVRPSYADL